jgi:hypothetical protein
LQLEHLVLDYNGTLAVDGELLPGAKRRLARLAGRLRIQILKGGGQDRAKAAYIRKLGPGRVYPRRLTASLRA